MKNLDDGLDDERLRKEFSPFGTITSAKVKIEHTIDHKSVVCLLYFNGCTAINKTSVKLKC